MSLVLPSGFVNRKETPLPNHECPIIILDELNFRLCEWTPAPAGHPSENYLGTARVIFGDHLGIGFHAWSTNEMEFIYYKIVELPPFLKVK